ncbi:MAG: Alcohol dehydrogenase, zinc-binding domain protein [candidate division TA06 bacterium 34_109]|uniref:Alcohol dehydrogenase, zinc-binding domain protein n=1 Tax=candidate division TA06 bacterium 34_109 TaxID=1635277 RepID=A0A117M5P5_UNCT6|nr:MAG: Alcohol dehydrogenase, zinc-binding domain protein [candidate division TA06 bacterium 34_109]
MKTKAVRIYGKNDLRLEEFDLPPMQDDEILAHVISDSLCLSSYKAAIQGEEHQRVPDNVGENPTIIGHEFCGEIIQVGKKWQQEFHPGEKFAIQPALNYKGTLDAPGYSFAYIGGDATYIIIPNQVMEKNCLLHYKGEAFYGGSLAEPMSCIIGAFHTSYHSSPGEYVHHMGIKEKGDMIIMGGAGPMGLGMIDYALHREQKPGLLVITDVDDQRLERAAKIFSIAEAKKIGINLIYLNPQKLKNIRESLISLTGGKGYNDIFVMAPIREIVELADSLLARDGCLNFFAGPTDAQFSASVNFYNIHYLSTHLIGSSGGNTADMIESLEMMEKNLINPAAMITHIGGLNCVVDTTLNLPKIPGGKKLIYTNIKMDLIALADIWQKAKDDPLMRGLAEILSQTNELWSTEAEKYLLTQAEPI